MFDSDHLEVIPSRLDAMEPGLLLAAILESIDVDRLTGGDRVVVLRARSRMAAHYQARVYGDMAAVADAVAELDDDVEFATEAAAAEIRVALRLTRRAADSELGFALDVRQRLPMVYEAMTSGDLDWRRARILVDGTGHLEEALARRVVNQVIGDAGRSTTGQLRARLRRECIAVDPDDAKDRFVDAHDRRRLVTEPTVDGTCHVLGMDLSPERVAVVTDRINRIALSLRGPGEPRSMDQLRADVFCDLLEGTEQSRHGGTVDIRVDLVTLGRLVDHPGELAGYGPVIADIARQVAESPGGTRWRYTVTDPDNGHTVDSGVTRRRPTARQRRQVETRNPTCVFPGCRMPATACDFDHIEPWADGGPTSTSNGAPVCRHDHTLRHRAGWTYQRLDNGDYQWTTQLGHTYTTSGRPP